MAKEPIRSRRERGSISAEEILRGAFAVAAESDLDSLSMPELAKHLGVGVTSIYWYFRKKDDLLRRMSDEANKSIQDRLPKPSSDIDWRTFLADYFTTLRDIYRSDDTLADLALVRIRSYSLEATHLLYQQIENIIEYLISAGFSPLSAWNAYSTANAFTRGIVIGERTQRLNNSPILDDRQMKLIVPETMPRLAALIENDGAMLAMVSESDFTSGLNLILDGFSSILDRQRVATSAEGVI